MSRWPAIGQKYDPSKEPKLPDDVAGAMAELRAAKKKAAKVLKEAMADLAARYNITKLKIYDYGLDAYKDRMDVPVPSDIRELWRLYNSNIDGSFSAEWTPNTGWTR